MEMKRYCQIQFSFHEGYSHDTTTRRLGIGTSTDNIVAESGWLYDDDETDWFVFLEGTYKFYSNIDEEWINVPVDKEYTKIIYKKDFTGSDTCHFEGSGDNYRVSCW